MPPFSFDNTYARHMEDFWVAARPAPVSAPRMIAFNRELAQELGLDVDDLEQRPALFAGAELPEGAQPLAQAYAGHQFGHFVPQLGDGRALLLGEVIDREGSRRDVQLKGSGPTTFSRGGDGLAAVGPVLREYLVSEAMHALGVPTTRALAAVTTGQPVYREQELPGAVLTRVASSHLRVGTFQFFSSRSDLERVRQLADYVITRHDPQLAEHEAPYLSLLDAVCERQAALIARWMHVGFVHGVMNTDNTTISGETIDYGPCAFMDRYDPATVFSSIDRNGRYAYGRQPRIGLWNVARFAETLLPLIDDDENLAVGLATEVVERFGPRYEQHWLTGMRAKLGLMTEREGDEILVGDLLQTMQEEEVDFTQAFRALGPATAGRLDPLLALFGSSDKLTPWLERWGARQAHEAVEPEVRAESMRRVNPVYVPRNHKVEEALDAAVDQSDYGPFRELLETVLHPFDEQPGRETFAEPAPQDAEPYLTFCGT